MPGPDLPLQRRVFDRRGRARRVLTEQRRNAYYGELTGRPVGNFAYYEVLANFKVAIILEADYARYLKGQASSPRVAHYNEATLKAGRTAGELVAANS